MSVTQDRMCLGIVYFNDDEKWCVGLRLRKYLSIMDGLLAVRREYCIKDGVSMTPCSNIGAGFSQSLGDKSSPMAKIASTSPPNVISKGP